MSLSKLRYEASKARLKPLTPIKETSNLYTPRVSEKKTVMVNGNKSMVVQTLPQDVQPRHPRENQNPNPYHFKQNDDLDQLVEEYLHYSEYRNTMPVQHESWDVNRTMTCACCQKRNMESMRLKQDVAMASDRPRASLELPNYPNPKDTPRTERTVEVTSPVKKPSDWLQYQPMPKNARAYIRPEYNRPYVLQDFYDSSQLDAKGAYAKTKIIDASARYQEAMDKLERTTKYLDPDRI